jgi:hypothetical protein
VRRRREEDTDMADGCQRHNYVSAGTTTIKRNGKDVTVNVWDSSSFGGESEELVGRLLI